MARTSKKLSRGEKKLFLVTGLAIAFLLGIGAWRSYVDGILDVQIPTPQLPSPNAFDFTLKRAQPLRVARLSALLPMVSYLCRRVARCSDGRGLVLPPTVKRFCALTQRL